MKLRFDIKKREPDGTLEEITVRSASVTSNIEDHELVKALFDIEQIINNRGLLRGQNDEQKRLMGYRAHIFLDDDDVKVTEEHHVDTKLTEHDCEIIAQAFMSMANAIKTRHLVTKHHRFHSDVLYETLREYTLTLADDNLHAELGIDLPNPELVNELDDLIERLPQLTMVEKE